MQFTIPRVPSCVHQNIIKKAVEWNFFSVRIDPSPFLFTRFSTNLFPPVFSLQYGLEEIDGSIGTQSFSREASHSFLDTRRLTKRDSMEIIHMQRVENRRHSERIFCHWPFIIFSVFIDAGLVYFTVDIRS